MAAIACLDAVSLGCDRHGDRIESGGGGASRTDLDRGYPDVTPHHLIVLRGAFEIGSRSQISLLLSVVFHLKVDHLRLYHQDVLILAFL